MHYLDNLILNTDSYKASHYLQYPADANGLFSYLESRGGAFDRTVFFGLQTVLKQYLSKPITREHIREAKDFYAYHGEPFNEAGWMHILQCYDGFLPLRIKAVPEGSVIPTQQVLATVECVDPAVYWLNSHVETLLMRIWYPITVATLSWHIKQDIRQFLVATSDNPEQQLAFKLHDFGARGVSSAESAALGGCAHLVNFMGTDTLAGILAARRYYHEPMAGYSIPAAEHSTMTAWGRQGEADAYRNMLKQFAQPGKVLAVVSDSYDIYHAVDAIWGQALRDEVVNSGAMVVIRPDSGDPATVVLKIAQILEQRFGAICNAKGYKVLNHVRIIQGDGINRNSIRNILQNLTTAGFSADNVGFGMGGGLLQQVHRDTLQFAMKASAIRRGEQWLPIAKKPVTDLGKQSKSGRLSLFRSRLTGEYASLRTDQEAMGEEYSEALEPVWDTGRLLKDWTFAEIRERASRVQAEAVTN